MAQGGACAQLDLPRLVPAHVKREFEAAQQAEDSGLYITWCSNDSGDPCCVRVNRRSLCLCGHSLARHETPRPPRAPKCSACAKCPGFRYLPHSPEELGMFWLLKRRDFDLKAFRRRITQAPAQYACSSCDKKVSDHTTYFEHRRDRERCGLPVGASFFPFAEAPELAAHVRAQLEHEGVEQQSEQQRRQLVEQAAQSQARGAGN